MLAPKLMEFPTVVREVPMFSNGSSGTKTLTPTSLEPGGGSMAKQALNNSLAKLNVKEDALFFR